LHKRQVEIEQIDAQRCKTGQWKTISHGVLATQKLNQQHREASAAFHSAQNSLKTQLYDAQLNLEEVDTKITTLGRGSVAKKMRVKLLAEKRALSIRMKNIRASSTSTLHIVSAELDSHREARSKARTSGKENIPLQMAPCSSSPEVECSDEEIFPSPSRFHHHQVIHSPSRSPSPEVISSGEAEMAVDDDLSLDHLDINDPSLSHLNIDDPSLDHVNVDDLSLNHLDTEDVPMKDVQVEAAPENSAQVEVAPEAGVQLEPALKPDGQAEPEHEANCSEDLAATAASTHKRKEQEDTLDAPKSCKKPHCMTRSAAELSTVPPMESVSTKPAKVAVGRRERRVPEHVLRIITLQLPKASKKKTSKKKVSK
jgi:hypothetical protein